MKPLEHAQNNVEKYGGQVEDYLPIHEFMDSSKAGLGDKRHRAIFHHSFGIYTVLPVVFGSTITNSDGKEIPTTQIGEDHVLEDFNDNFIPTLADYLQELPMKDWMDNGKNGYPPSRQTLQKQVDEYQTVKLDWANMPLDGARKLRDEGELLAWTRSVASD